MRRFMVVAVVVLFVLATGLSYAQGNGPKPMPEKVRGFLDNMTGTWSRIDGDSKATAQIEWDAGKGALIDRGTFQEEDMTGSWSELWLWDGTSEDGVISYWSGSSNRGFARGRLRGRVLSETLMEARKTAVRGGQEVTSKLQIKFTGSNQVAWRETDVIVGGKKSPDVIEAYTIAKATSDERELIKLQHEWCRAEVKGDAAALGRLLADEYVLVISDGTTLPRAQLLREVQSEDLRLTAMAVENPKVQLYGNMAVVKGVVKWSEASGTKHQSLFTEAWQRRDGRWQCIATHESGEEEAPPAKLSPELKKLEAFVGDWVYEGEQVDPPVAGLPYGPAGKYSGTITTRFILGGRFLESRLEDKNPGGVTRSFSVTGYDPKAKQYVLNVFLSDGSLETVVETASPDGRTWTTKAAMTTKEGETILLRSTIQFSSDWTTRTDTTDVSPDGGKTWKYWCRDTSRKVSKP